MGKRKKKEMKMRMMKETNRRGIKGILEQQYNIKKEMRRANNYVC